MKKLVYAFITAILLAGCDYVELPVPPQTGTANLVCDTTFTFSQVQTTKHLLIEEFTGHYCTNCPQAAWYLQQLKATYGEELVLVAIHPSLGSLTDPQSNGDNSYSTDWRIEEGQQLYTNFAMPGFIPIGMLSRTDDGSGNNYHYHTTWQTKVPAMMGQAADISIRNEANYNATEDVVCVKVEVEVLNSLTADMYLTHYLVEDSIADYQKIAVGGEASGSVHPDYPAGDVSNYYHRHVLRDVHGHVGVREGDGSGNGSILGALLKNGSFSSGEKFQYVVSFDNLDASWSRSHLYVVSFVHDNTTGDVLQVSETHVQ
jgi:hypothetical protein